MARIITSEIQSFAPLGKPYEKQKFQSGEDKFAKVLGIGNALVESPLVGLAGYGLETAGKAAVEKYGESEAVSEAEAKWQADQDKKAKDQSRQNELGMRRNQESADYRSNLQANRGIGAQVEQLARDKAEIEQLARQNPDLMKPDARGNRGPLAQKYQNLVAEEARLRFGLRKQGAADEPYGIRPQGSEDEQFKSLSRTGQLYEVPSKAYGQVSYEKAIPSAEGEEQLLANTAMWLRKMDEIDPKAEGASDAFKEASGHVAAYRARLSQLYQQRGLDQAQADKQALTDIQAKWTALNAAKMAELKRPDEDLAALGRLPKETEPVKSAPAPASTSPAPAPAPARPVQYAPPAETVMVNGVPVKNPVTEGTRALTQRAGERSEELRKDIDEAVQSLQTGLQAAGLSGDEALKRAQQAVEQARATQAADNQKFMDATDKFTVKEPIVEIDEATGRGRIVRRPETPSVEQLVQLARLADTKEKQSRIYELAGRVDLPWGTIAERFSPGRHTKFAQEIEKLFPTTKKGLLDEAADLAYKFAKVQSVGAGIGRGQQQVELGRAGMDIRAAGAQGKIDAGQVKGSLDIDKEAGKAIRAEESLQTQIANAAAGRAATAGLAAASREATRTGRGTGEAAKETDPIVEAAKEAAKDAKDAANENRKIANKPVPDPSTMTKPKAKDAEATRRYAEAVAEWTAKQEAKAKQAELDKTAKDAAKAHQDALKAQAEAIKARSTTTPKGPSLPTDKPAATAPKGKTAKDVLD